MTQLEALTHVIDYIRSTGTEERSLVMAAKVLERKTVRMRARSEVLFPHWCDCGERKRPEHLFCTACYSVFPAGLTLRWHTGTSKQSAQAFREMVKIAQGRLREEREAA